MLQETAYELLAIISKAKPLLESITENEASQKSNPKKWSKKEILGHLIDSACNNQKICENNVCRTDSFRFCGLCPR